MTSYLASLETSVHTRMNPRWIERYRRSTICTLKILMSVFIVVFSSLLLSRTHCFPTATLGFARCPEQNTIWRKRSNDKMMNRMFKSLNVRLCTLLYPRLRTLNVQPCAKSPNTPKHTSGIIFDAWVYSPCVKWYLMGEFHNLLYGYNKTILNK